MTSASLSIDTLLRTLQSGDEEAADRLFAYVYDELRRLAHVVRSDGAPDTLNTTALLHEAYLHLKPAAGLDIESELHFFRVAARVTRAAHHADVKPPRPPTPAPPTPTWRSVSACTTASAPRWPAWS